jgi:hypothetical protein
MCHLSRIRADLGSGAAALLDLGLRGAPVPVHVQPAVATIGRGSPSIGPGCSRNRCWLPTTIDVVVERLIIARLLQQPVMVPLTA